MGEATRPYGGGHQALLGPTGPITVITTRVHIPPSTVHQHGYSRAGVLMCYMAPPRGIKRPKGLGPLEGPYY